MKIIMVNSHLEILEAYMENIISVRNTIANINNLNWQPWEIICGYIALDITENMLHIVPYDISGSRFRMLNMMSKTSKGKVRFIWSGHDDSAYSKLRIVNHLPQYASEKVTNIIKTVWSEKDNPTRSNITKEFLYKLI